MGCCHSGLGDEASRELEDAKYEQTLERKKSSHLDLSKHHDLEQSEDEIFHHYESLFVIGDGM